MLNRQDDIINDDGTVDVCAVYGSKISPTFKMDYEDYLLCEGTYWWVHPQTGHLTKRIGDRMVTLTRYIAEQRGFAPEDKPFRIVWNAKDKLNVSKKNWSVKYDGVQHPVPRGIVKNESTYTIFFPLVDEDLLMAKGTYTDINEAILNYRQNIIAVYKDDAKKFL